MEMHDLLYTFGKELGAQGSRRLWNHKGVVGALKKRAVRYSLFVITYLSLMFEKLLLANLFVLNYLSREQAV